MGCRPDHKTVIPLYVPQRAARDIDFFAYDVTFDETGAESSRARTDLTGAVVFFEVRDANGAIVIQKNSLLVSQVVIGADQSASSTSRGQATVKLVGTDTDGLTPGATYYYDVWVKLSDGRIDTVIDKSRFHVCDGIVEVPVGPPQATPGQPASQSDQFRSFTHTWSGDGVSDTVTIPGNGMVDATYCVAMSINTIPSGGVAALLYAPESTRTTTQLVIQASASLKAGTIIDIILRDRT